MSSMKNSSRWMSNVYRFTSLFERAHYAPHQVLQEANEMLDRHEQEVAALLAERARNWEDLSNDVRLDQLRRTHEIQRTQWRLKSKLIKLRLDPLVEQYNQNPQDEILDEIEQILTIIYAPL